LVLLILLQVWLVDMSLNTGIKVAATIEATSYYAALTASKVNSLNATYAGTAGRIDPLWAYGELSDFSFGLPALVSSIDGISIDIYYSSDNASGIAKIKCNLSHNDGTNYTSDTSEQSVNGTTITQKTFGGSADTHGRIWSVSDFNNGNFRLKVNINTNNGSYNSRIDLITVTVYYTPAPKTLSVDSYLNKIGNTKVLITDAYLSLPKRLSIDSCLNTVGLIKTPSIDSNLNKIGLTKTLSIDTYLQKSLTKAISIDSYLKKSFEKLPYIDSFLQRLFITNTLLDSYLEKLYFNDISIDTILNSVGLNILNSLDSYLKIVNNKNISIDTIIETGSFLGEYIGLDAHILQIKEINIFIDSMLVWCYFKQVSLDSIIFQAIEKNISLGFMSQKSFSSWSFLDALLVSFLINMPYEYQFKSHLSNGYFVSDLDDYNFVSKLERDFVSDLENYEFISKLEIPVYISQ
jgi:hypothetical protein